MKPRVSAWSAVAVLMMLGAFAVAQSKPATGFEQMKTLVGEWEGKTSDGRTVRASYRLASAGTALIETLNPHDEPEMVTVYTADGNRLAVTHYCSAGNQPRMHTEPITGPAKEFQFSFTGATNLSKPSAGHMHALKVTLEDNDHFTQAWTWRENGQDKSEV